ILELLVHINKRLRSRSQIQLPIDSLIKQYANPDNSFFITNFSIIYIKMGFPRMPRPKQLQLLPELLSSYSGKPPVQKDSILHLSLCLLKDVKIDDSNRAAYSMTDRPDDRRYMLHFFQCVLLISYHFQKPTDPPSAASIAADADAGGAAAAGSSGAVSLACDGVCDQDFRRVAGQPDFLRSPEELESAKIGILRFLGNKIYTSEEIVLHFLIGNADTRHSVVSEAETCLKFLAMTANWENESLISQLFVLLLGSEKTEASKPSLFRLPASVLVRRRLLPYLLRSRLTVPNSMIASTVEIVFDCLDEGERSNKKLMSLGLDLINHVAQYSTSLTAKQANDILKRLMLFIYKKCPDDASLKAKAFIAFGNMVPKSPEFAANGLALLQELFQSLSDETGDVKMAVRTCLNAMAPIFVGTWLSGSLMEALLFENIEKNDAACRQTVKSEAQKAFAYCTQPNVMRDIVDGRIKMPPFVDFVNHDTHYAKKNPFVDVCRLIPVVEFIRLCLLAGNDGLPEGVADPLQYEEEAEFHHRIMRNVRHYMAEEPGPDGAVSAGRRAVDTYFRLIQVVILTQPVTSHFTAYLQEVLLGHTRDLVTNCKQVFDKIRTNVLYTSRGAACRSECATILALVSAETETKEQLHATLAEYASKLRAKEPDTSQGALLGLCHLLDRLAYKKRAGSAGKAKSRMTLAGHVTDLLKEAEKRLQSPGRHPACTVLCNGISVLGNAGLLAHLPAGGQAEDTWPNKQALVKRLLALVKSTTTDRQCREAALRAISGLAHGEPQMPHSRLAAEGLVELCNQRDPELHLSIAETLCALSLGSASPYRGQWFDREYPLEVPTKSSELLLWACDQGGRTGLVLGLLRRLARHPEMPLVRLHAATAPCLTDRDAVSQELACRCLCLASEVLGEAATPDLPAGLLNASTGAAAPYAELATACRAAGLRALAYPLMSLACASSDLAAFADIRGLAGRRALRQLRPHLDQLAPRLYRLQFEPRLQPQAGAVWRAMSGLEASLADRLLEPLLAEQLIAAGSADWRLRESACLALSALLTRPSAATSQQLPALLPRLVSCLLRLTDDSRDTVREAASQAFNVCSRLAAREPRTSLPGLLPVLLELGLASGATEARTAALRCLTELARSSEAALRPHLVKLVTDLLQALSGLEPAAFITFSQRLSGAAREQVDTARISAMQTTPVFDLLKVCVKQVDQPTLDSLVPHLTELIRKGVGLGTKCGTAQLLVSITDHCGSIVAPYTGKLLAALLYGVADRNPVVQRCMSLAIGQLISYAKQASVEKLLTHVRAWYLEKEDDYMRRACGQLFHACARHASDILRRHSASALPLIFLAAADVVDPAEAAATAAAATDPAEAEAAAAAAEDAALWKEAWTDCAGSATALADCVSEALTLFGQAIRSAYWPLRAQGAAAVKQLAAQLDLGVERTAWLLNDLLIPAMQSKHQQAQVRRVMCEAAATLCVRCPQLAEAPRAATLKLLVAAAESQSACLAPAAQVVRLCGTPVLDRLWEQVKANLPGSLPALGQLWVADPDQQNCYLAQVCEQLVAHDKDLHGCLRTCRELVERDCALASGGSPPEPLLACAQHLLTAVRHRRTHFYQDALHLITCLVTCMSPSGASKLSAEFQDMCTALIDLAQQQASPSLQSHFDPLLQDGGVAAAAAAA
uniref:Proteasome-associated protein ECM29-like protein n=1 Tax=Macrostomum lignano TaxID=282301 RepID=A0A1I8HBE9_9PLAT